MITPDKLDYDAQPYQVLAEYLHKLGWRSSCDAQWSQLRDNMATIHLLSAEPWTELREACLEVLAHGNGEVLGPRLMNRVVNLDKLPVYMRRPIALDMVATEAMAFVAGKVGP